MPLTPEDLQNRQKLEATIWRLLARGAADAKHPFKLFSIATVNANGLPDARTVVLRSCDIGDKELCFHTDIRSGKIAQIKKQPEVCLLFWHPKQSLQLRIFGEAQIHHLDEKTKQKIASLPPQQMALYGYDAKPGSIMEQVNQHAFDETLVVQNFAWVRVSVHTLDALHLGRNGVHTRVQFSYDDEGLPTVSYLQP
jgi:pyridoxine/pyridoxamine 5'-phosphate oxidase